MLSSHTGDGEPENTFAGEQYSKLCPVGICGDTGDFASCFRTFVAILSIAETINLFDVTLKFFRLIVTRKVFSQTDNTHSEAG